ncbi:4Fe-4S binding protein [Christensenellaceae bacterium 44-20]
MKRVAVDLEKCTRCGACVRRCPFGALRMGQEGLLHAPGKCVGECGICRLVCPEDAITYAEVSCGGCQGGSCGKCGRKGSCQGCKACGGK